MALDVSAVDLLAVRDRLKLLGLFLTVGTVADAAQAMATNVRTPSAFVGIASESASPNRTQAIHDQAVEDMLSVLVVVASERKANDQADVVEDARRAVIGQLAAWVPPGARRALDYAGYRIVQMGGGLIWFECTFRTGWHLRGTAAA